MIKDRYIAREFGGDIQNPRDRGLPRVMSRIEISSKTGYHVRDLRHMIYSKAIEIKERGKAKMIHKGREGVQFYAL